MCLTWKLHTGAMWQVSFKNKLQSSLRRLNLGSRLAKIKSSEKKTNKGKANKKGDDQKLYNRC